MKSKKEIKNWLLKNCVDEYGDLDLSELDFSDFNGDIDLSNMKVKNNLYQCYQEVGGFLNQSNQKVNFYMFDNDNEVKGMFLTQTLKDDEEYEFFLNQTYIVKKLKEIKLEELEELGYKLKEK